MLTSEQYIVTYDKGQAFPDRLTRVTHKAPIFPFGAFCTPPGGYVIELQELPSPFVINSFDRCLWN